jgi:hypothetical protein
MSRSSVRLAALAGAAAVALGVASPTVAAAQERSATVQSVYSYRPASAVVEGRTVTVRMPASHYQATADHTAAVVQAATVNPQPVGNYTPQGATGGVVPAYTQNVTPASSSTGTISIGAAMTVIFGGLLIYGIKRNEIKKGWAFVAIGFGVFTGATIIGTIYGQIAGTGASTVTNILGSL